MAENKYNKIHLYLKSLNFHFQQSWVKECVDYYNNINPNMNEKDLMSEVRQQWLLLNLRDMKVPAFPSNIKEKEKIVLTGKYAVQVETLVDSGHSRYSQLQTCRQETCENVKATHIPGDELPSRRCLTMTLTDGVQELYAMEYELIPSLKINDPDQLPGFKAIIIGPVICRKGMLLLKSSNILVCGGEVDALVEKNKYEALLMRCLGVDETTIPSLSENRNNDVQDSNLSRILNENDDFLMDVEVFENESQELLSHTAEEQGEGATGNVNSNNSHSRGAENENYELLEEDEILRLVDESEFSKPYSTINKVVPKPIQSSISQFLAPTEIKNSVSVMPKLFNHLPFQYLNQIASTPLTQDCDFRVKAIIITLKTKIAVQGDAFSLQAKICDGSLAMDVLFSSNVLEDLLGFSPSELSLLLKEKNKNTAVGERIRSAYTNAQEQLIALNCILIIRFSSNRGIPVVQSLEPVTQNSLHYIKLRNDRNQ